MKQHLLIFLLLLGARSLLAQSYVSDLVVSPPFDGGTIKWYTAGGALIESPGTTSLADGTTYYASQTVNGAESTSRLAVAVTAKAVTATPVVSHVGEGDTKVQGTCAEANGTVISIFKGGNLMGTMTMTNATDWEYTITAAAISDTYTAQASATNKCISLVSNSVTVDAVAVGDTYQGGKVFYIFTSTDVGLYVPGETHGFIAAVSDNVSSEWGCQGTSITGADGQAIGTGNANTVDITTGCTTAGIAARLCYDLVTGGRSDWYLPSYDELTKLFLNKDAVGGFSSNSYWSSSEQDANTALMRTFPGGGTSGVVKSSSSYVSRAIRRF